jgi:hypothetical protein
VSQTVDFLAVSGGGDGENNAIVDGREMHGNQTGGSDFGEEHDGEGN